MDLHVYFVSDHISALVRPHKHEFFQMIFCQSGQGSITVRDTKYTARPGFVYLIGPRVIHAVEPTENLHLIETKFSAYGDFEKLLSGLPDVFFIDDDPPTLELLRQTVREGFHKQDQYNRAADALYLLFWIRVARKLKPASEPKPVTADHAYLDVHGEGKTDMDMLMIQLREYIEAHLTEPITLEMLASRVHFNKTYFVKRFRELWGFSPMKFVNTLRLQRAEQLLLTTQLPLSQIARQCGFSSLHYFSRRFHESYGISPQTYRNQHKKFRAAQ